MNIHHYGILLSSIVFFWVFVGVIWPAYCLLRYNLAKAKITKVDFILTKDEHTRQKKILHRIWVSNKLVGFTVVSWVTLWSTTFLTLVTSINYLHSTQLEILDRRPWVTINAPQVILTTVGQKTNSGNPLLISTYVENIGKTPAVFDSEVVLKNSYPGIFVTEEEPSDGVLFPGEKRRIGWIARWNNEDEAISEWARTQRGPYILCVLCGATLRVNYKTLNTAKAKDYFTLSELEWSVNKEGYIAGVEQSFKTIDAR